MWRILDFIFPPRADELILRGVTNEDFLSYLSPCLVEYTRPATVALLPFSQSPVRAALHETKYHGNTRTSRLLGSVLAEYLQDADNIVGQKRTIILIPVPLGKQRRKERGFNQVEQIATTALKQLKGHIDVSICNNLLTRTRETVTQVTLPREKRTENMRGAFTATRSADPAYLYIVVDDVITTGATLQAAVDALTAAGAAHIIPLALAH